MLITGICVIFLGASLASGFYVYKAQKTKPIKIDSVSLTGVDCSDSKAVSVVKPNTVRIENKTGAGSIIGTGFFEPSGYLVTNSHVVDTTGEITVYYPDSKQSKATLASNDIVKDIAILSVESSSVKALPWGKTTELKEPDTLIALGFALNLPGEVSVTKGSFSARRSQDEIDYLQTDTPVNSGNSGGPLINTCGQVVGINSLSSDNATINMAISAESASSIISDLSSNKKVTYYDGKGRNTALSKLLKVAGFEQIATEIDAKSNPENEIKAEPASGNSAAKPKQGTSSSSGNSSSSSAPKISCSPITVSGNMDSKSFEINQVATLNMYAVNSDGASLPKWSGPGTFSNSTYSNTNWSNNSAGNFDLTATINSKNGECSSKITIEVLSPIKRVDNLASIQIMGGGSTMYDSAKNEDYFFYGVDYRNSAGSIISQINRASTLPISVKLTIYLINNNMERVRAIYSKTFSNSEISSSGGQRSFRVLRKDLGLQDSDFTDGKVWIRNSAIISTPEQGDFTYEDSGSWSVSK